MMRWTDMSRDLPPIYQLDLTLDPEVLTPDSPGMVMLSDGHIKFVGRLVEIENKRKYFQIINKKFDNEIPMFTLWATLPVKHRKMLNEIVEGV